jgi:hypothetical protein
VGWAAAGPQNYLDTPEYSNGRPFAEVEVHRLGVWVRTLNEAKEGSHIQRSLTTHELRQVLDDIDAAVDRVQHAGLPDPSPNADYHAAEAEQEAEDEEGEM